jgi:hypothetical protein
MQHAPRKASGTFEVQATHHPPYDTAPGATLGRSTLAKQFRGDLEATSVVEMTGAMTDTKGSAGYVAIERVTGSLHGRHGTFVLQHSGTMDRGALALSVSVVPDSATGDLAGLRGTMSIQIIDGRHLFDFEYVVSPPNGA